MLTTCTFAFDLWKDACITFSDTDSGIWEVCGQYAYLSPEDIHTHTQTFSLKVKLHKLRFLRIDDVLLIVVAS